MPAFCSRPVTDTNQIEVLLLHFVLRPAFHSSTIWNWLLKCVKISIMESHKIPIDDDHKINDSENGNNDFMLSGTELGQNPRSELSISPG